MLYYPKKQLNFSQISTNVEKRLFLKIKIHWKKGRDYCMISKWEVTISFQNRGKRDERFFFLDGI